jgi:AcrR family transcriptional regulator
LGESRSYQSPLRREQAEATQNRILESTYQILLEQGSPALTMAAVAKAAGVSAQTVYKTFGSKAALIKRVYDVTLVGDAQAVPFAERPEVRATYELTDPRLFLAGYAGLGRLLLDRLGPLMAVIVAGARAGDPDLVALMETTGRERLIGTGMVAQRLADLGALRPGLSVERARDALWTLNSVEVWNLLVTERGWTRDEYQDWVARAMIDAVLAPAPFS